MFLYFLEFKLLRVILWRLWTFPWPLNVVGSHSPAGVVTADLIFPFNKGSPSRGVQPCCPRDTFLICLLNQLACCCCCGSAVSDSVTPRTAVCQASLSFPISWSLLKLMSIELVMSSNHLILCHPLLLLPPVFPSIKVFSSELALYIRWPKYWSSSFIISPSNEYLGLISLKIDWFDLLAVQGTLKSLLQHHSLKASMYEDPKKRSNTYLL